MDNQNQKTSAERQRAERKKQAARQRLIQMIAILVAIVLSIVSICVSCSTKKAVASLAEQLAVKKAAQLQEQQMAEEEAKAAEQEQAETEAAGTQITLSFIGDVTLCTPNDETYDGCIEQYFQAYGASYFFENVRSTLEGDDLTIANLECCLTSTADTPAEKSLLYRADPSYSTILMNSGIDAISTDNDHTVDYEDAGFVDTLANLDIAGLIRFGDTYTQIVEINGIQVGLCEINILNDGIDAEDRSVETVQSLKDDGAQLVVCAFHWGSEGTYAPTDTDIEIAHAVIDAGADIVVASHPKVLQGIECYKGKYICYSLGSFLNGSTSTVNDPDTIIFQQTFTVIDGEVQDNASYNIIPCMISSSDSELNNFKPVLAEGEDSDRILSDLYDMSSRIDGGISEAGGTVSMMDTAGDAEDSSAETADAADAQDGAADGTAADAS